MTDLLQNHLERVSDAMREDSLPTLVVPDDMYALYVGYGFSPARLIKHSDTLRQIEPVVLGIRGGRADALIVDDLGNECILDNKLVCDARYWGVETGKKRRHKAQWKEETQRGGRRK